MKAIILAAGRGSRMKELTDEKPKCLVEINGKKLLELQLDSLRAAGISEIAIVTGYKREIIANRGLTEFYNSRWAETQMVSSLECAREWLESGPCIVSYSDIFYSQEGVKSLIRCSASIAVSYDPNWLELWKKRFRDPLSDAESFRFSDEGILLEIGNKPVTTEEIQGQYMGLLLFTPEGWFEVERIRKNFTQLECDRMDMTSTLQHVVKSGVLPVVVVPYDGVWGEVDSESDLLGYQNKF